MGLRTNNAVAEALEFKQTYCTEVALRLGKKMWSFPKRWECQVSNAVNNAKLCQAPVADFVKAQFKSLPETFCLRVFDSNYPPIFVFSGEKARRRYRGFFLDQESKSSKPAVLTHAVMMGIIHKECRTFFPDNSLDLDLLMFGVSSGSVSLATLSYLYYRDLLNFDQVKSVIGVLPEHQRNPSLEIIINHVQMFQHQKEGKDYAN